jgi:hypothetical protein
MLVRVGDITNEMLLPKDSETRRKIAGSVRWEVTNDNFQIPEDVKTVGELVAALQKTPPIVRSKPTQRYEFM